jgi:hypothetical protein
MSLQKTITRIANNLEQFATNRADFRHVSDEDKQDIARRILIHSSRERVDGHVRDEEAHRWYHLTGEAGISYREAWAMWRNVTEGRIKTEDVD